MSLITISRFDEFTPSIASYIGYSQVIRRNRFKDYSKLFLLSIDSTTLIVDGIVQNLNDASEINNKLNYITLTNKEKEILLKKLGHLPPNLIVLEKTFPFINGIKYISDAKRNLNKLQNCIKLILSYGLKIEDFHSYAHIKTSNTLANKISKKSILDYAFYFLPHHGYQEVFSLFEDRKNKAIICLDFNSMYLSCMDQFFPNISKLEYVKFENNQKYHSSLPDGLYLTRVSKPNNEFIKNYHYFKYTKCFDSSNFIFDDSLTIEVSLLKEELEYFKLHFDEILIVEAILFNEMVKHPLINISKRYYKNKERHLHNKDLKAMYKSWLSHTSSACASTGSKKTSFNSFDSLADFLSEKFSIHMNDIQSKQDFINSIKSHKKFEVKIQKGVFELSYPNYESDKSIHCYTSIIISRARLKMLKSIQKLASINTVTICYTNVDSIHFSINKDKLNDFYKSFSHEINTSCGGIKIEAIGTTGMWLDIGRYWIFDHNKLTKFSNAFFNKKGDDRKLIDRTETLYINSEKKLVHRKYHYLNNICKTDKLFSPNSEYSYLLKRYSVSVLTDLPYRYVMRLEQTLIQNKIRSRLISLIHARNLHLV